MHTALYVIWILIPSFFFLMALWAALEQASHAHKKENPADFVRQGAFVAVCVVVAILIDRYALETLVTSLFGDFLPLLFYQIILLPFLLYLGARLAGPSQAILIGKSPHPSDARDREKPSRTKRK